MAEVLNAVLEIGEIMVKNRCPDVVVGEEALDPLRLESLCLDLRFNEVDAALKATSTSNQLRRSQCRMAVPDSGPGKISECPYETRRWQGEAKLVPQLAGEERCCEHSTALKRYMSLANVVRDRLAFAIESGPIFLHP